MAPSLNQELSGTNQSQTSPNKVPMLGGIFKWLASQVVMTEAEKRSAGIDLGGEGRERGSEDDSLDAGLRSS